MVGMTLHLCQVDKTLIHAQVYDGVGQCPAQVGDGWQAMNDVSKG